MASKLKPFAYRFPPPVKFQPPAAIRASRIEALKLEAKSRVSHNLWRLNVDNLIKMINDNKTPASWLFTAQEYDKWIYYDETKGPKIRQEYR
ncbi:uncharacterized protein TRUGW13939_06133 [Talaromyces rugulosus]|uniref:WWE domain-containing protein n=1 Tax=Talaromyces rugulosus TaxID=121627 RepID=A0A7H8QY00_TALRU|nr:uncharacterized protein TRUGW13939_06133 [Talaromyces rugulosus]QKX59004.1 hypothetical protein TRUGW13939_06133 [Talaromyces rugulosus]